MNYIVKDTIINLENLEERFVSYYGKDDYGHDLEEYAEPWSRRHFAEKFIEQYLDGRYHWYKKVDDKNCIENSKWLHHFEIIQKA